MMKKIGAKNLLIIGRIDIRDLDRATSVILPECNYEAPGGFLIDLARDIPEAGNVVGAVSLSSLLRKSQAEKLDGLASKGDDPIPQQTN